MIFIKPSEPIIKYGEFLFEIKYDYEGESGIIKDTIICKYERISFTLDVGNTRNWKCYFKNNIDNGHFYIDKENNSDLYIYVPIDAEYYIGASDSSIENARPYINYDVYAENTLE